MFERDAGAIALFGLLSVVFVFTANFTSVGYLAWINFYNCNAYIKYF